MRAEFVPTDHRTELAAIKRFDQLVRYLRDPMGWPIDGGDFEELTFEYTPEELGIDAKNAAKIQEIKRLRPLSANQPWGIFFVKFEPKSLPVIALRRILSSVALKKRASANAAERAAWAADDLLFISNYGAGEERQISFAHFSRAEDGRDLPTLKVLGWDNLDTALHLDAVAKELTKHLAWPKDDADVEAWRQNWRTAFNLRHREVVATSKELSIRLAELARAIRDRIGTALAIETDKGPLTKLMKAFQQALVQDLDAAGFADMYAQTIAYGLLSARIADPEKKTADDFAAHMRTNPFLRELMETFLKVGGRRGKAGGPGIDFDELGVSEVIELLDNANMEAVIHDFGDRNRQEDPVIHFYELFLGAYNKRLKVQRGVFYTPQPVVSYIVRTVHELLQTEFGLADGLADITTWGELLQKNPDLKLPLLTEGPDEKRTISPSEPFVQILDPATGTATFLVEVIDVIHRTLTAKWDQLHLSEAQRRAAWDEYVPKHLLPRLHGYELMMAPYAIAHMKLSLKLHETGYQFGKEERARIYLTNALEPWIRQLSLPEIDALAHEAVAVNEIKRHKRFTVVIGNPPYSVISANFNPFIESLMYDYKKHVRGEQGMVALADDYLKFIRLTQLLLAGSNYGLWGMITNHGFLKGIIHRGVRQELLSQFKSLFILDLHGDSNIGEKAPAHMANGNMFDIKQGVAMSIGLHSIEHDFDSEVRHSDLWGSQAEKYADLASHESSERNWTELRPTAPNYFLIPFNDANLKEYQAWPSLDELMMVNSCGVKTHRDGVMIDYDKKTLIARFSDIASERRLELLRERYGIKDTPHWRLKDAQPKIRADDVKSFVRPVTYRPFDFRWMYYNPAIIEKGDSKYPTLRHMLHDNVALLGARIQATGVFDAIFVSKFLAEMKTAESSRSCTVFPLYLADDHHSKQARLPSAGIRPNLNPKVLSSWTTKLGLTAGGDFGLPADLMPEDIFRYAYGVFHSPTYRVRYAEFLKIGFPRLPLSGNLELVRTLARLGGELVALHTLETPKLNDLRTQFIGGQSPKVEKISWSRDTVWLNKAQTAGFCGVCEPVWNFHIGGYQVCEKWLKDRKGLSLSKNDVVHYQKIVAALSETIRIMQEIDEVLNARGGFPMAFDGEVRSRDYDEVKIGDEAN